MKKFLFTLAAMFMVSSASATCYLYMDNITVTAADEAQGYVEAVLKMHLDHYVSAFNCQVILPEGVTMDGEADPLDGLNYTWYNSRGKATNAQLTLLQNTVYQGNPQDTRFVVASQQQTYEQQEDGTWAVKGYWHWAPGEYEIANVYYAGMTADMKNVEISIWSDLSASGWTGTDQDCHGQNSGCRSTHITIINPDETPVLEPAIIPTIAFSEEEGVGLTITVTDATSYEVIVDNVNMGQITYVEAIYDATQTVVVNATNETEGHEVGNASDNTTVQPKAYAPAVTPGIAFEAVEGGVNITVTDATSWEVIVNDVNMGQITYVAQTDVDQHIVVNAVNEAEHQLTGNATDSYDLPKKETTPVYDETAYAPNTAYVITGYETATVTITNREEGATVYYVVYVVENGVETTEVASGSFEGGSYSFPVTGDGSYIVHTYAHIDGKNDSADGGVFFTIYEDEDTGISELVNGKTVAGVRYFNMAGQEMQEANGMTIVVTTYTDGTTSAVKVMK